MSVVPSLTVASAEERIGPLPRYAEFLSQACVVVPPPYGMAWYGERYRDPDWLAGSLVDNAAKEGEGAKKLWELAGAITDPAVAQRVRRHALDESLHARYYIRMIDLAFPGSIGADLRSDLEALSPGYSPQALPPHQEPRSDERLLDELVQINIGEIRTRIHQMLLRPVLTVYCPDANTRALVRLLQRLLKDETKHVAYTAHLIDRFSSGRERKVGELFTARVHDFNLITLSEVGEELYDGA
jgi:hypothetical protein